MVPGKIFITGATGFIGAYIVRELVEHGYQVRALKRRESRIPFFIPSGIMDQVEWIEGDLMDVVSLEEGMEGVQAVVHAAAMVSFHKRDQRQMYRVNIEGTANVVNIALAAQVPRFVHISSVAAIGRKQSSEQVTEDQKWEKNKTTTHYSITKFRAEVEVWRGIGEGLNAVILNPSTVIGFGDWNSSSSAIFKNVYHEFPWYTHGINGFVGVEDVARAARLLMESPISEERFIVSSENWSFRQLFDTIAEQLGKKKPSREATPFLGEIAWRVEGIKSLFTGKRPLLTRESARVAQSRTYFNNRKILDALAGFSFTPLVKTIENASKEYLLAINKDE